MTASTAKSLPAYEAFAVTYRRPETLERTLRIVLSQSRPPARVLVVDNDPAEGAIEVTKRLSKEGFRIDHRSLGGNKGPAGAAAAALSELHARGVEWALWLDDDDPPKQPDDLERLLGAVATAPQPLAIVGAVGHRWSWKTGRIVRIPDADLVPGPIEVDYVAGGCQPIINVPAAAAVGYPDARLFFGLEELEFCLRLRRAGYAIVVDGQLMRERRESAGRLNLKRPLMPLASAWASPWRQYYSTRNYIFFTRTTFSRPDLAAIWAFRSVVKALAGAVRHPREGRLVAAAQLRGIRDGYLSRMGKTELPREKLR